MTIRCVGGGRPPTSPVSVPAHRAIKRRPASPSAGSGGRSRLNSLPGSPTLPMPTATGSTNNQLRGGPIARSQSLESILDPSVEALDNNKGAGGQRARRASVVEHELGGRAGAAAAAAERAVSPLAPLVELACDQRHLVLNFDVNKTIVMMDSVTGKSMEDIVNAVLAGSSWGVVLADGRWECAVREPCVQRPETGQLSYFEFLERRYPGKENKVMRDDLCAAFTGPGGPGRALRPFFEKMMEALKLPHAVRDTEAATSIGLNGSSVFIIPAFFELLLSLKAARRSFSVVFRTFGKEMEEVVQEFNAFCEGRHPLYPGAVMDGSDGEPDMRASLTDPTRFGTFYRDAHTTALVLGTLDQPDVGEDGVHFYSHQLKVSPKRLLVDPAGEELPTIRRFLARAVGPRRPGTLALRDYFPYWRACGMKGHGGKLFLMDSAAPAKQHEMFFDDNIRYTDAKIVDVRDAGAVGAASPTIERLLRERLIRAEPLLAIHDPGYFVREVQRLEAALERRLRIVSQLKLQQREVSSMRIELPQSPPREDGDAAQPTVPAAKAAPRRMRRDVSWAADLQGCWRGDVEEPVAFKDTCNQQPFEESEDDEPSPKCPLRSISAVDRAFSDGNLARLDESGEFSAADSTDGDDDDPTPFYRLDRIPASL